jgi:hypothetical protein
MIASDDYKLLQSIFSNNNIHLYMAADNWTQNLLKYVNDIFIGGMTESNYIEHCNIIINTHDKKLIDTVIETGKKTILFINKLNNSTKYTTIKNYIENFKPTYEYINSFNFTKTNNEIEKYCKIMKYLKTFVTPFEKLELSDWKNKLSVISNFKVLGGNISEPLGV